MPSTKQLARWAQQNANGWNIEGVRGIVPLINEAQNILMQTESEQTLAFDETAGNFPSFDTESEVYEYDMPANIWRVSKVLVDAQNSSNLNVYLNEEYGLTNRYVPDTQRLHYAGREYIRIPYVKTTDRTFNDRCKVKFFQNPTELESIFLYRGYNLPEPQITSASINPSLPDSNGLHMRALLPAVNKLIEAFQTNDWEGALSFIQKELKPVVQHEMNSGEQGRVHGVTRREF